MSKAKGMFRWAICQLDTLKKCLDRQSLKQALNTLPEGLDGTYGRILRDIPHGFRAQAIRLLQFLVYSKRPLRLEEAVDVIAVNVDHNIAGIPAFDADNRLPRPQEIARFCASLTKLTSHRTHSRYGSDKEPTVKELELAHFSVQEYLLSDRVEQTFRHEFQESRAKACIVKVSVAYLSEYAKVRSRVPAVSFPLRGLSSRYWFDHAALAETDEAEGTSVSHWIYRLLNNEDLYETWLHLYDPDERHWSHDNRPSNHPSKLYYTCMAGIAKTAGYLLRDGAYINAVGGYYGNALQAASEAGHTKVVLLLLARGVNVNAQGGAYGNALYAALEGGHTEIVRLLLEKGADLNAQGGYYGNPLWWRLAAVLTCKSIVKFGYRGERLIEPSSSWFLPKFPSG